MKLSMLKLLITTALLSSSLFASLDSNILAYEKSRVNANPNIVLEDASIYFKKKVTSNWWGYAVNITLTIPSKNKTLHIKDILFTNGKLVTPELKDLKTHEDLKSLMMPKLSKKYFNTKNLIAGNLGAKHTLVIFSDPMCPFCIENFPKIYQAIKKSKNIAMFYYDFPLKSLHPASDVITRYLVLAKKAGIDDLFYKIYTANLEKYFKIEETNPQVIVPALNKILGLHISVKDTMSKKVYDELQKEITMGNNAMVRGTPTIFFDGKYDVTREKFKKYLK